jgi:hypothetical protein
MEFAGTKHDPVFFKPNSVQSLCMRARGGSTSLDVLAEARHLDSHWFGSLSSWGFEAAFVQVGIVDTSPRLASKRLYLMLLRFLIFRYYSAPRDVYKAFGRPWLPPREFMQNIVNIDALLGRLAGCVLFVEIAMPSHHLKDNVGDFSDSISYRNDLISRCFGGDRFVSCWWGVRAAVSSC